MHGIADIAGHALGVGENTEASGVAGTLADRLLQPFDRLDVVVEDVRPSLHDLAQRGLLAVEVGDQYLHAHGGAGLAQPSDGVGEDMRPAVGQIVPGDRCHHHVLQP